MIATITAHSGLNPSAQWGSLSSDQHDAFITAYGHREGWHGNQLTLWRGRERSRLRHT
ncbi:MULTISPECIES: hypothetical protein [Xanthomonas]|uniref:Uncharacterized protein n=1 Tax=Xanthomonas rydalmerensis TaxID=3046274 RepID=A0ABZ0JHQ7_9XANT|nr:MULTISPECIES: hypothetical protein [unclassified Xanthomonas]MBB5877385.1 hypothetical protein [Xanthomonas sp. 3498]WOS39325.1 hypothetical protein QN243_12900 [Xanthomonas sp. DM-2023]WOS43509.1 hypothetical protein QN242_12900 [Xanthomonas sp. DM-2023]WOS47690.1 hypothetical protein QN240_12900 [Xanthomonas sp. DM-2023]WOS51868.1 hypothetical protein QN244_12900 [Xanthomonas sp. DM-2023]